VIGAGKLKLENIRRDNMLYRQRKGSLAEELETVVELPRTLAALATKASDLLLNPVASENIKVTPCGFDQKVNRDTFLISVIDHGVIGYTNENPA
jgi:hypothetical protein